jgi:hypothetical protein
MAPLCAFASLREMSFLIQAAVLAKAQRRKGREGETPLLCRDLILKDHLAVPHPNLSFEVQHHKLAHS